MNALLNTDRDKILNALPFNTDDLVLIKDLNATASVDKVVITGATIRFEWTEYSYDDIDDEVVVKRTGSFCIEDIGKNVYPA